MDMRKHVPRWLNSAALATMDDRFEGEIVDVREQQIRNRFTTERQLEPVIYFPDGWRLIPNIGMRKELVQLLGPETNTWKGHRLVVYQAPIERTNKATGEVTVAYEKRVMLAEEEAELLVLPRRAAR
jgi:hypothetical protein